MATGTPTPPEVRAAAMRDFVTRWRTYATVSAAVIATAQEHGIGKTTLRDWLVEEDLWPSPQRRVAWLEQENTELRRVLSTCQCSDQNKAARR